jgi:hypothetical protein
MENTMSVNLILMDHASKDQRSVPAMLRGTGDGREQSWQSFEGAHPTLTQEELMEKFRLEARYGRITVKRGLLGISLEKYIAALIAFAIIVA